MGGQERFRAVLAGAVAVATLLATALPASAAPSQKKAIWGPIERGGVSQFPIYEELGVGVYQMALDWRAAAPSRPAAPGDPSDPAYQWPADVDQALAGAGPRGIQVLVAVTGAPGWANGGRSRAWAPKRASDFAQFLAAASRRYPGVRLWLAWGEPSKRSNFKPLASVTAGRRVTPRQRVGPRRYAKMLDAAYAALKGVDRGDLVVGGNTFTSGTVPPLSYIKLMRLPGGKPPRMDLYGHNPFSARKPRLSQPPLRHGYADFGDLDKLSKAVDRKLARPRGKRHLKLFLSEYTLPTDHSNWEFNFWVDRGTQARWLRDALGVARGWSRIYSLGWLSLYDDPPRPGNDEVNRGLLEYGGKRKPAFKAYAGG